MLFWIDQNSYKLMLVVAGLSIIVLLIMRREKYRLSVRRAVTLGLMMMALAVVGSKLLYMIESGGKTDGMSLFGGAFLVLLCMPVIGRLFSMKGAETLDACLPCGAAVLGFMRFGCYLSGCCGGRYVMLGTKVFQWPTQLMESFCDFCILALLLQVEKKNHRPGTLFALCLTLYCCCRFLIEFLRDTPKNWLFLSHGQWFSIAGCVLGLAVLIYLRTNKEGK